MQDVIVGIQARMGSSRLPGKVMLDLAGLPMIRRVWDACEGPWERRVLVSEADSSRDLRVYLTTHEMAWESGSELDVLSRYVALAKRRKPLVLVRVCADAPFLNKLWIADAVNECLRASPVFIPGALHAGSWYEWVACGDNCAKEDREHAGAAWFEKYGLTMERVPPDYRMVNTEADLAEARKRLESPRTGEP